MKYVINHYTENLDGKGYTKVDTQGLEGTSGSTVSIDANTYEGFTAQTESQTATIAGDGTTVIDFYYARNSYTITFVTNGGSEIEPKSFKYEETIPSDLKPTRANYTFAGWYTDEKQTKLFSNKTMPANNLTLYAYYSEETKASFFIYKKYKDSVNIIEGKNLTGDVVIPEYIGGNCVTSIGDSAFWRRTSLTRVVIPEGVTSIGIEAFRACESLESVTIPDSVTSIGDWAFGGCESLKSVTIPDGVASIGHNAFSHCESLTSVSIGNGVTSIEWGAFEGCVSLASISIPNSITSIDYGAFEDCSSLKSVTIPDSVTSIGDDAFEGCTSLKSVTIPDSVTSIGDDAFEGCRSLTSIVIPEGVTSIGSGAFDDCDSLTIYCAAEAEPEGWSIAWNFSDRPVVWGYKSKP